MATHTNLGGENYGRRFSISRKNGQVDKNGWPYFFEWVKELPNTANGDGFETRKKTDGSFAYYELFSALDGILTGISVIDKDFGKGLEKILCLFLSDNGENYIIELGRPDHRYSMDFMKRILDPNFNPNSKLRVSPYSITDAKTKKSNMGISTFSGANKLLASRKSDERPNAAFNPNLEGIPQADTRLWKGETNYDFTPVSNWLMERVNALVIPRLKRDPISAPRSQSFEIPKGPEQEAAPAPEFEPLPF